MAEKKCACSMTSFEILQSNLEAERPNKTIIIIDRGNGWDAQMYGPDTSGWPLIEDVPHHVTIQSTIEAVEEMLVKLRRQADEQPEGEVVTDPEEIVSLLSGGADG